MTILVTGGTGFVGSAVVRRLLAAGYAVRAMVRGRSDRRNLAGLPLEMTVADLTAPETLRRAVRGCTGAAPRRCRLSALGAGSRIDVRDQRRGHLRAAAGGGRGGRVAHRVHQQRRDARNRAGRRRRRGDARPLRGHDRALQALEVPGRGGGARALRRARLASGDRQPFDARRTPRHQADADGAHGAAGRRRKDARLCRYRAQSRPCRRRRRWPPARLRGRRDRRALYPGRREHDAAGDPRRHRRAVGPPRAASAAVARAW